MLLELYDLHRCLREAGIIVGLTDNRIQRYPNRPALEVRLDLDGNVTSANLLPRDRLEAIRKFECSTGGSRESAPGFNVDPLYRVNPKADVREVNKDFKELGKKLKDVESSLDDRRKAVDELRARCEPNWDCSIKSKINLCLSKAAHELREQLADATNPYIAPLTELLRRSEKLEAKCLHEQVAGRLVDALVSGETGFSIDSYLKILFNEPLSMVLELGEDNCYGGLPANHEAVWYAVNEHLVAKNVRRESNPAKTQRSNQRDGRIGVFGEVIAGQLGKMPERNLPRLGKVKLFSLANIPCQARYGLIESEACPAEPEIQGQLAAALQWVTESDRKDKTWTDVSNSCGYNQAAVLVAYASKMPPVPAALTGFFASEAIDDDIGNAARTEGRFESRTASLVQTLRGMLLEDPGMTVSVMVIAKADAARKKLLLSRQLNGRRLIDAAGEWQRAARNHPPIFIRRFDSERKSYWARPWTPFPTDLVLVINAVWDSNGGNPRRISNARLGLGLALLLETGQGLRESAREALRHLVQSVTPLTIALARSHACDRVFKIPKSFQDVPLLVPTTIGLVLAKGGSLKEIYMGQNPYLIGRLLSMADRLHRNYCDVERKGESPPQLIGNALMATALENPVAGLARLAERLPLYQRVAPVSLRLEVGGIEQALDKSALPTRCTDEDKAQMLLGYLARPDLERDAQPGQSNATGDNHGQ